MNLDSDTVTAILRVARAHGATEVRVFGSRARGDEHSGSDLDLLVTFKDGRSLLDLVAAKQELEEALGYPVELLTPRSLSPYLRERILREAVSLDAA